MSSNASEVRPANLREARDAMAEAHATGSRVLIRGAGTAQSWGAPPGPVDLIVDTTGLDTLIAYNPADMTVAAGAGTPLSALQAGLSGQRIALDAARIRQGATVGGLLATADAGPLRATYGSLRDLVIGVTVVLADGTVARSGGHVIKNVAGYDLAKLFSGSLGAFGLVAEVVLRVHPRPEHTATLAVPCDVETAIELSRELLASPLEPVAVDWHSAHERETRGRGTIEDGGRLLVGFEGTASGVDQRLDKAAARVHRRGAGRAEHLAGESEARAWQEVADIVLGASGDTVFRAGTRPDRLPGLAERLDRLAAGHGVAYALTSSTGIGVHTVRLLGPPGEGGGEEGGGEGGDTTGSAAVHAGVLRAWREEAEDGQDIGAGVTVHRAPKALLEKTPAWGRPPDAAAMLRSLKQNLDPGNRLAPGRFAPWMGGTA